MMLRLLNFAVIGALVLAAAYVYRVKFNSTVQAEHLAKINSEVRHARDSIAALRAEWGELDNPARIQALANRFLHLKTIVPTQYDTLDRLPDRPPEDSRAANNDPIASVIENLEEPETVTGSIPAAAGSPGDPPSADAAPDTAATPATSGAPNQ